MNLINGKKVNNNKIKFIMLLGNLNLYLLVMLFANKLAMASALKESNEAKEVEDLRTKISTLKDNLLLLSENPKFKTFIQKMHGKSESSNNVDLLHSLILIMEYMQSESFLSTGEPFMFHFNLHIIESIYDDLIRNKYKYSQINQKESVKLLLNTYKEARDVVYSDLKKFSDEYREQREELVDSYNEIYGQSLTMKDEKKSMLENGQYDPNAAELLNKVAHELYSKLENFKDLTCALAVVLIEYAAYLADSKFATGYCLNYNDKEESYICIKVSDFREKVWNHIFYLLSCSSELEKFLNTLNETKNEYFDKKPYSLIEDLHSIADSFTSIRE